MKHRYFLLLPLLALCACGFHLRGTKVASRASVSDLAIKSVSAPLVDTEVRSQLQLGGTRIVESGDKAKYVLTLRNEAFERDVLSVSADTGKVKEYQLTLHVIVTVSGVDGKPLVDNETISSTREYTFDESSILGKSNEETSIREDLVGQVSAQIVRRVNAVIGQ